MVFSSVLFLFLFLPIVLGVNFILKKEFRNAFLLLVSLFFYAWGEHFLVLLMLFIIAINYIFGIALAQNSSHKLLSKVILSIGIAINLSILGYYKYIHFIIENMSKLGWKINLDVDDVTLPLGISFFTFQSVSYLFDVYRKGVDSQKNLLHLGLYISLFPQLIAGPIVRYSDIHEEIKNRTITKELFSEGVIRFIRGLAKKVIIANNVGLIADEAFKIPANDLSTLLAWVAIICYTLQIYFDFSGYSDMAIGLGKMFGFNFKENFNYPYIAKSIQDFWRRWHISLSTWFRDYLYIPLGGNKKSKFRTYLNLIIVFFITGLWHGASWNFVVWGLYHGFFLLIERTVSFSLPKKFSILKRGYLLIVVIVGWVIFRSETLSYAIVFIKTMFSFSSGNNNYPLIFLNSYYIFIICAGIVFSTPIRHFMVGFTNKKQEYKHLVLGVKYSTYLILFLFSISELAHSTYNPFIYFRF